MLVFTALDHGEKGDAGAAATLCASVLGLVTAGAVIGGAVGGYSLQAPPPKMFPNARVLEF